jgi:carbonyl reductase 1
LDLGLRKQTDKQQIEYRSLDIIDPKSIHTLADDIRQSGIKLDVLINNAGVNLDDKFSPRNVSRTLEVNHYGTITMCQAFLDVLKKNGRIVNLSSVASNLKPFSAELQKRFRRISSIVELSDLMDEYEEAVKKGKDGESGFPTQRSYSVSKAALNAYTALLAKENPGKLINCCCPGWVNTDMGNQVGKPPKTPREGATIPVRLALGELNGISGRYWANDSIRSREDGKPQFW